jgi:uncharacterized protein YbjT (DUF2867 family)
MILVTGATGMNGSAAVRELVRRKVQVRALVRDRARGLALGWSPSVEIVEGDMLRQETLGRALDGVTRALMISSADPSLVATQVAFIDAAKKAGVRHIVKFSGKESNIGYDAKSFRFTRMHEEIERYLERSGVSWTHLRPSQFMQVFLREAPTIAGEGALFLPFEPTQQFSPVDVEDIAKVACELLLREGYESKSYDMTGPEALTLTDIAGRISEAAGKPVRVATVTLAERRQALLATGASAYFVDALDEQTSERRRCPASGVDLAAHRTFGVRPTTFAEFARRHADTFRTAAGP